MISEEAKLIIEENPVAIATCVFDVPDTAVVKNVKVVSENQILIGDNYLTTTKTNIIKNGKVSLVVWNQNWKDDCFGYKMTGRAEYQSLGKWMERVKDIHKGFPSKGAIIVTVDNIKRIGD